MKSTVFHVLVSAAVLFGAVAPASACGPNSGPYRTNTYPSYPSYPPSYPTNPPVETLPSPNGVSALQGHITVVSTDSAPSGSIQLARPVSTEGTSATIHEISTTDKVTSKSDADVTSALDATAAAAPKASKIDDSIKGLVGTWMAVSRQHDGELSTVELQLDDHGWAKLTVPGADGKPSTTTRKVEVTDNEIRLTGSGADVTLGKLVDFNDRQMVLARASGELTFVRP
jgi:hypothetical protein